MEASRSDGQGRKDRGDLRVRPDCQEMKARMVLTGRRASRVHKDHQVKLDRKVLRARLASKGSMGELDKMQR